MIFGLNSFAQKHLVVWKVINHIKVFRYNCGCLESWLESCVGTLTRSVTPRPLLLTTKPPVVLFYPLYESCSCV